MTSKSELSTTVAVGAGIMAVIGAIDTLLDEGVVANTDVRAGWKTLLGCAGLYLNVMAFTKAGGKFEDQNHLGIYLASLAATASLSLYMARK